MKLTLLLPGYLDSPHYLHMKTFKKILKKLGFTVERLDPCNLWETGNTENYSITNYVKQIKKKIDEYKSNNPDEVVLIGHSMGALTSIIAGNRIKDVTKIVSLCPPPDREYSEEEWKKGSSRFSKRDLPDNPKEFREFSVPYSFVEDGFQYSAVKEVKKIKKPLMIFIALNDTVVLPEETEKIVANANSPHVVRQPNMGHDFRHSQKECDLVTNHIEEFLSVSL
jgi:esterase/lipase